MPSLLPAATLHAMLDGFERLGFDRKRLEDSLGPALAPSRLAGATVEVQSFGALWAAAERQRRDPALPTALGLSIPYGAFGLPDYLAGSRGTVGGGFESLAAHLRLVASGFTLELDRVDGMRWVRLQALERQGPPYRASEMTVAILVARFRAGTDGGFRPAFVCLRDAMPKAGAVHEPLLGVPVRYASPMAAVVVPEAMWRLRLRGADDYLQALLTETADQLGVSAQELPTLTVAIRARLRDELANGRCDAAHMAKLLGLSERTMQRALSREACTFSGLVDDFRRDEALRLVGDPDVPLVEVASRLGYGEQTSLTRAFRRWTGQTPRQSRRAGRA